MTISWSIDATVVVEQSVVVAILFNQWIRLTKKYIKDTCAITSFLCAQLLTECRLNAREKYVYNKSGTESMSSAVCYSQKHKFHNFASALAERQFSCIRIVRSKGAARAVI